MRGGMKTYRGSPAAARNYVEADRGRADDYYLAEGTGIAQRYVASPEAGVQRVTPLSGDAYEAWVAGVDPETGVAKGRLRHDDQAVRFVEVTVNGPKSWSLAAELQPEISTAYDAAQDRAATQIIGRLGQHATTRVGPRGRQVQMPVQKSRRRWCGITRRAPVIPTVIYICRSTRGCSPPGHGAACTRLASGIRWMRSTASDTPPWPPIPPSGPHSRRTRSPSMRAARSPSWRRSPVRSAPARRRSPARSTATRPTGSRRTRGKLRARRCAARGTRERGSTAARTRSTLPDGSDLNGRWRAELATLGYYGPTREVPLEPVSVGSLDHDQAVDEVLTRLAARRSGWNAPDVRGEVELLLARRGIVTGERVRLEWAEDLTARTLESCVPLLDRAGVPEHIRALTFPHVLEVEGSARPNAGAHKPTSPAGSQSAAVPPLRRPPSSPHPSRSRRPCRVGGSSTRPRPPPRRRSPATPTSWSSRAPPVPGRPPPWRWPVTCWPPGTVAWWWSPRR